MEFTVKSLQWLSISTRLKSKFLAMACTAPQDLVLLTSQPLSLAHCALGTLAFLWFLHHTQFTPTLGPLHCWPSTWCTPHPPSPVNGCSSFSLQCHLPREALLTINCSRQTHLSSLPIIFFHFIHKAPELALFVYVPIVQIPHPL